MKEPIISVRGLRYSYPGSDDRLVLNDISLEIFPGEVIALLGANGSGKSTLARHLNGLLIPNEGQVVVAGLCTGAETNVWEIRKKVGMVFQNPDNQLVAALVEEELAFGMENLGVAPDIMKVRIKEMAKRMDLERFLEFPPNRLSGGQKQRVAIAAVLVIEPDILILDEPTSMLDPAGRREVMEQVANLKKMGKTVILVTHDMDEAATADRVVILDQGKVVLTGTPKDCFSKVEIISNLGLTIPPAAELARRLIKKGHKIDSTMLKVKDWADYLCRKQ
ncbi:energy-coupling factor transporter ATPase [Desulforamulus aquiferis]|uniref:Energy-coupling factor transporter ATPase n=1 Tax=Desulforamulus aquiferis TaxID=1397668 RepID=A0AAW7ZKY1_9FIRM|nr:energy-coupling factor transporter ATPase [Desulforamulus aquiferis]MDO7788895.1 energy-coupling factor transporter ATPase [Desulforamulus aquiferis]